MHEEQSHAQSCGDYEASPSGEEHLDSDDKKLQRAKEFYTAETERSLKDQAPTSGLRIAMASEVKGQGKLIIITGQRKLTCNAYLNDYPHDDTLSLRCHPEPLMYCLSSLIDLIMTGLVGTTLFPPCCYKIAVPLDIRQYVLPQELVDDFDLKVEELTAPNPACCAKSKCNSLILLRNIENDSGHRDYYDITWEPCARQRSTMVHVQRIHVSSYSCMQQSASMATW
jgi:hypothetical protein